MLPLPRLFSTATDDCMMENGIYQNEQACDGKGHGFFLIYHPSIPMFPSLLLACFLLNIQFNSLNPCSV